MTQPALSPHTPLSTSFSSAVLYCTGWSVLAEAGAMNIEKALEEGKLLEVVSVARETLETASRAPVSIAVTGDTGNGMSSFINGLRGIGHEEEASAPTGVVRTTQTRACYSSSRFPNVALWDLPGTGAAPQSLENYPEEMQFSQYDLFIIVASEQFSMNLVRLAKTIQGLGKRFYVVWTKLDRDLSTSAHSEGWVLKNIRENIRETLQKEWVCEPPIFLVSSLDPFLHDFPELRDTLHRDLSESRCRGPLENLSHTCEKIINDKATSLQERIASQSLQDTLGIQDADDLEECLKAYRSLFGVDDESLQQVAQSMGTPVEEYRAIMKSQDLHTLFTEDWAFSWMNCNMASYLYTILSYVPLLGDPIIHYLREVKHRRFLEIVAEDTKTILKKVLKDSID